MATYVNDLRLKEIATGDESGTWGTSTNTNLELIAEAFSFGTEAITTNADTHTTTIADGSTDPGRSIYLQYTGALNSDCTVTIGPNTVSKLWFIENATTDSGSSGPYNIIIKQGSGATVTVPNGQVKAIYSDGAGSGGAMVDAFQDLSVPDLFIDDDLTFTSDSAVITFGADGDTTLTHTDGSGLTLNSTNKIMFNDASQFIQGSSATVLSLGATDEIDLTATAIDVNGTMDISGALTGTTATLTTAGNTAQLVLKSTDADSGVGPRLDLTRDSASPADGDAAGQIRFLADNDAGTETSFGFARMLLTDVSDGAEDGQFEIDTRVNGTNRNRLNMTSTETVFNEDSIDLDFRVESNSKQGMFIVDAGDDVIKMGGIEGSGSGTLKVKSNSSHHAIALEENSGSEAYSLGVVADGSLIFANSGTEVVRFDDSGNVGIGTNNPSKQLHQIRTGSASDLPTLATETGFITQSTNASASSQNISIIAGAGGESRLFFGDTADEDVGHIIYSHASNYMLFSTAATERVRIDASGNLLVGRTSVGSTGAGHSIRGADSAIFSRDGGEALILNRDTSDGQIIDIRRSGTTVGTIGSRSSGANLFITFRTEAGGDGCGLTGSSVSLGAILPSDGDGDPVDDHIDLGSSTNRFDDIFATNGTINTSDRNEKQDIEELSDAEKRVAVAAKGLIRKFRWKSAVAEKNDAARIHVGIIAQDLKAAFEAEGLDAARYAMFCSDTWTNDDGSEQTRLGVRYSELLAFIIAAI